MSTIGLFVRSYATYLKSMLEYRPAFVTDMMSNIIAYSVMYLGIWILMDKFKLVQGWSLYEVMFLFNLNMVSYGICSFVFRTLYEDIQDLVQRGNFDIILIRPGNSLVYTLLGRPTPAYFGHMVLGTIVFSICFTNLDIQWSPLKILYFISTLLGATLIQAAMYLFTGTLGFWFVRTRSIFNSLMFSCREFVSYPVSIYHKFIQLLLTVVLPFAFVNFYPAHYFLDKDDNNLFHPILQYLTPVIGIVLFFLAYRFWTIGVNKYESTGS